MWLGPVGGNGRNARLMALCVFKAVGNVSAAV